MMLKILDLFSGIGGFSLGLESTGGFATVAFCETDPFCRKVLAKHWPGVPIYGDVKTLDVRSVGNVDVVCGGFPCQPFSAAGKRRGTADDRHLWPSMLGIIKALRPTWVIGENVAGLVSMEVERLPFDVEGRTSSRVPEYDLHESLLFREEDMLLDGICTELEAANYEVQPFVIPVCAVDAPHRRDRVWIVARAADSGLEGKGCGIREGQGGDPDRICAHVSDAESHGRGSGRARRSDPGGPGKREQALQTMADREGQPLGSGLCAGAAGGQRRRRSGDGGRASNAWAVEPDVGRVADGIPDRVDRLGGLGNAVVPRNVKMIAAAILQAEREAS